MYSQYYPRKDVCVYLNNCRLNKLLELGVITNYPDYEIHYRSLNLIIKGCDVRVDAANTNTRTQRHVHIERDGKKASWNVDGSRHDKHSFNENFSKIKRVREIAAEQLGINSDILRLIITPEYDDLLLLFMLRRISHNLSELRLLVKYLKNYTNEYMVIRDRIERLEHLRIRLVFSAIDDDF